MPPQDSVRQWLHLGVTGHRFLARPALVEAGVVTALADLTLRFPGHSLRTYSSLAEGADRMAARLALERPGGKLVAVLPLPRTDYESDFGTPESLAEFRALLARASIVVELRGNGAGHGARPAAYVVSARYILDRCDVLLAVWDGLGAQGAGGTAEVVALARSLGKPVAWIHAGNRRPGTEDPVDLGEEQGRYEYVEGS